MAGEERGVLPTLLCAGLHSLSWLYLAGPAKRDLRPPRRYPRIATIAPLP